jgi:L-threonylcarbamoyladenylate synthase
MIEEVRKAGIIIMNGGCILYPTDTIWGIGCDATNPDAVQKVYQIKQRSDSKSMLVIMNNISMLSDYLECIPESAEEIINSSVKPTTIIFPGAKNFAPNLLAEDGSVGIRITSDPFCQQLIEQTGKPIVSTSANISGKPPANSFREIDEVLRQLVDHVVEWRQNEITPSIPSSILKIDSRGKISVIRP